MTIPKHSHSTTIYKSTLSIITMTILLYTLILTHITIVCVTLYLHRAQAHRGITIHPILAHLMRFWLWLTTGMVTKQWVAIHRKHHRFTDQEGDPHSPHVYGIKRVFFNGAQLYHQASKDSVMVATYGQGTPYDWVEKHIYTPHSRLGIALMLAINLAIFGWLGIIVWAVQMLWIPLWAAGFINGIGHWWGYRNGTTKDHSRNISPIAVVVGGEELHNNHHLDPANPKLSRMWWEFDLGWLYIKLFGYLGLITVKDSA